jgi:hypothetical protein
LYETLALDQTVPKIEAMRIFEILPKKKDIHRICALIMELFTIVEQRKLLITKGPYRTINTL